MTQNGFIVLSCFFKIIEEKLTNVDTYRQTAELWGAPVLEQAMWPNTEWNFDGLVVTVPGSTSQGTDVKIVGPHGFCGFVSRHCP